MFTNSATDSGEAAFVKRNDPWASDIADLVAAGFLIRTRADADTLEAVENATDRRERAFASGAQYVSTDYPEPDLSLSDYSVAFENGDTIRCNPINTAGDVDADTIARRITRSAVMSRKGMGEATRGRRCLQCRIGARFLWMAITASRTIIPSCWVTSSRSRRQRSIFPAASRSNPGGGGAGAAADAARFPLPRRRSSSGIEAPRCST